MRKITTSPKLLKAREELILQLRKKGFFIEEIAEIFRLQRSRISQIVIEAIKAEKDNKLNNN